VFTSVGGSFYCEHGLFKNYKNQAILQLANILLIPQYEDYYCPTTLVHSPGALLATGGCADFYTANYLAHSLTVPDNRIHYRGGF
jgi:hypothetical protein